MAGFDSRELGAILSGVRLLMAPRPLDHLDKVDGYFLQVGASNT